MKKYVTVAELEKYSGEVQRWMQDQILLNYNQGKRITKLEQLLIEKETK